mgnify:CR=1 FL=1
MLLYIFCINFNQFYKTFPNIIWKIENIHNNLIEITQIYYENT